MNKNAFTLTELIAVIVIIGLILLFVFPAINDMLNDNNEELYKQYENMMVEYAKASNVRASYDNPNVYLKLSDIDGLVKIKQENCKGYVHISYVNNKNIYKGYVSCEAYQTAQYDATHE